MSGLADLAAILSPSVRRRFGPRLRRAKMPRVLEKAEQANGVALLYKVGCPRVYVLGTHRRKAESDHGTHQTPGISDVIAFLPRVLGVLFWEVKARGGKSSDEQAELAELVRACTAAGLGVHYCLGTYDDLIAWLMSVGLLKADQVPYYRVPPPGGGSRSC
jgi:hypothetical protein